MSPFEPVGKVARWRLLFESLFTSAEVNHVVTYVSMAETLGLDADADRHLLQVTMQRVAKEMLMKRDRALEAVPNVGYRVVEPSEHLRLAQSKQQRSRALVKGGRALAEHVDMTGMDVETRRSFDIVARAFSMQMEMMRRLDVRQSRLEDAVKETHQQGQRSAAEIDALKARLAALEARTQI